jgi:predicted transcriptional regulator
VAIVKNLNPSPNDPNEIARTRLTLDLSERLNDVVERLAKERGMTKADILRTAIEFLTMADAAKSAGMHVGAWEEGNGSVIRREREFVGF